MVAIHVSLWRDSFTSRSNIITIYQATVRPYTPLMQH
ncbi:hypothetical protein VIBHAR_06316 [Vibrio campbellii ATCC BAA-1116]|uniref:Uncharacterized protein n=1 Tax=Vibrio campbellii (strain ATCC BAA-1116) TaxID=2902295 RepID=A7N6F8_VIBC1|nr:hypothetical protein VIBHAR_06316 [Vibrio campbellii ATCC BAA-1116]